VSACASDHSYPIFAAQRKCQLPVSMTLGGTPERGWQEFPVSKKEANGDPTLREGTDW